MDEKVKKKRGAPEQFLFKKGQSGNKLGRPKGSFSLVGLLKKKLQEHPEGKDRTYAEYFIDKVMSKTMIEGDVAMMRDIIDRVDGKPKQAIDHTTNGKDLPVPIIPLSNVPADNSNE
jgi:hypothetical protein